MIFEVDLSTFKRLMAYQNNFVYYYEDEVVIELFLCQQGLYIVASYKKESGYTENGSMNDLLFKQEFLGNAIRIYKVHEKYKDLIPEEHEVIKDGDSEFQGPEGTGQV